MLGDVGEDISNIALEQAEIAVIASWGTKNKDLPFICPKCNQETVFRATKCESCGNLFLPKAARKGEYADRCPECGFSKREQNQKNR